MNKDELVTFHDEFCDKMHSILQAKNADYTGGSSDPFANFTAVERNGVTRTEVGFLVRMTDKMQRINAFVQKGDLKVNDEKVEDTLMDLANYCILFAAYLESKHGK